MNREINDFSETCCFNRFINCRIEDMHCDNCGWNDAVADKRLEKKYGDKAETLIAQSRVCRLVSKWTKANG